MKKNDWKDRLNVVYSTNPDYKYESEEANKSEIATPTTQTLRIELDKRNGKPATLITDFRGSDNELKELSKILKNKCATGGSQRDGEILIQGDFRVKIAEILQNMGYKIKKINFK